MGQVLRNLFAAWADRPDAPQYRVLDPWPVEWRLRRSLISPLYFAATLFRIIAARMGNRIGLLHVHMAGGGSVLRKGVIVWLARILGVPVIVHLAAADIDTDFERWPRFAKDLLRRTLEHARFIIVLGTYWQGFLVNRVRVSGERVVVIPNGVPDPLLRGARSRAGPCRLLSLGRLGTRKGAVTALEALADPRIQALDWTATFAGDGEVDATRRYAEQLGLHDRCKFPGWVERDDVADLLQESHIFLLASSQEGLPVAILEAMAHGLAIITMSAGSISDAIVDGETGFLVPVADISAFADAIYAVLTKPELRRRLQRAARERYQRDYTSTVFADRVLSLYRRCGLSR